MRVAWMRSGGRRPNILQSGTALWLRPAPNELALRGWPSGGVGRCRTANTNKDAIHTRRIAVSPHHPDWLRAGVFSQPAFARRDRKELCRSGQVGQSQSFGCTRGQNLSNQGDRHGARACGARRKWRQNSRRAKWHDLTWRKEVPLISAHHSCVSTPWPSPRRVASACCWPIPLIG